MSIKTWWGERQKSHKPIIILILVACAAVAAWNLWLQ